MVDGTRLPPAGDPLTFEEFDAQVFLHVGAQILSPWESIVHHVRCRGIHDDEFELEALLSVIGY